MTRASSPNLAAADAGVAVFEVTTNMKMGPISVTHASQETCPSSCALRDAGCYAERGNQRFATERVNAGLTSPFMLPEVEAVAIHALSGHRKLRVHVVGDCPTSMAARVVGRAMVRHEAKHRQLAWTYTHAWDTVPAYAWGAARVLASVHSRDERDAARANGYRAFAVITPKHLVRRAYDFDGMRIAPCPAQFTSQGRRASTCESCDLCPRMAAGDHPDLHIGFEPDNQTDRLIKRHGQHAGAAWPGLF